LPGFKVAIIAIPIFIGSLGLTVVSAVLPDPPLVIPEGPLTCKSSLGNDACKESGETQVHAPGPLDRKSPRPLCEGSAGERLNQPGINSLNPLSSFPDERGFFLLQKGLEQQPRQIKNPGLFFQFSQYNK